MTAPADAPLNPEPMKCLQTSHVSSLKSMGATDEHLVLLDGALERAKGMAGINWSAILNLIMNFRSMSIAQLIEAINAIFTTPPVTPTAAVRPAP